MRRETWYYSALALKVEADLFGHYAAENRRVVGVNLNKLSAPTNIVDYSNYHVT